jgi:hypothetical protein
MRTVHYKYLTFLATGLLALMAGYVSASDSSLSRSIDGIDIHMGITHAQAVGQDTTAQKMGMMKGLRGKRHHVTVALFDSQTGQRITDAKVVAMVGEMGLSSNQKRLKPEKYGEAVSYGRDFYINKEGPYWVDLKITRNGSKQATMTRFEWKHF